MNELRKLTIADNIFSLNNLIKDNYVKALTIFELNLSNKTKYHVYYQKRNVPILIVLKRFILLFLFLASQIRKPCLY